MRDREGMWEGDGWRGKQHVSQGWGQVGRQVLARKEAREVKAEEC